MVRSLAIQVASCCVLCAAAVVHFAERGFDWLINVLPASPPRISFAGEPVPSEGFGGYADPHVQRHEAGMSRRAAMRGI